MHYVDYLYVERMVFMPYITTKQSPIYYQISFDDILDGTVDLSRSVVPNESNTRTYYKEHLDEKFLKRYDFDGMIAVLKEFNAQYANLFTVERRSLYDTFYIPKKSGGLREINAPKAELMNALRRLKTIFEVHMFALYHTSAFAYIKNRCTVDSIKRHQQNESKWFAKLDFSNFFGSTTPDFVMSMFSMIFPFSEIVKREDGKEALQKALDLCFLNGGLPQGTPISPTITNVMMIPIDHQICNELRNAKEHYIYTRYADDILISSRVKFNCNKLQDYIIRVLKTYNAPFVLKKEKTRYGSSAGRNWNLGVMLNKDNQITIGYQKAKNFKAMCCNYISDKKSDITWDRHDVQVFSGLISYYRMIEKEYVNYVIDHYNEKFGVNIEMLIKNDLK